MAEETTSQAEAKPEEKKKGLPVIAVVGIGCFVFLFLIGLGITVAGKFLFGKFGKAALEQAIEKQTGVKTDISDIEKGKVRITDPKTGETVDVGSGTLPQDFPKSFPIYPNATVTSTVAGGKTGTSGFWVTFGSTDNREAVEAYYKKELASKGWTVSSTMSVENTTTWTVKTDALEGSVAVTGNKGEQTQIVVILGAKSKENE